MKEIVLAGGCFWGVEKFLSLIRGVSETETGYANGTTASPTYRQVCTGETGFAEAVRVVYDGEILPLSRLLALFFEAIDPVAVNRQGNDIGTQYRTGIYYTDETDRKIIETSLAALQEKHKLPLAVEALPLSSYYKAEDFHQKYLDRTPQGYCHIGADVFRKAIDGNPA